MRGTGEVSVNRVHEFVRISFKGTPLQKRLKSTVLDCNEEN